MSDGEIAHSTAAIEANSAAPAWRKLAEPKYLVWVVLAACIAAYSSTWVDIVNLWRLDVVYKHGFLLAIAALWALGIAAAKLNREHCKPSYLGVAALGASVMMWIFSKLLLIAVTEQVAVLGIAYFAQVAMMGRPAAQRLAVPFAWMFCAIQIWNHAMPILQALAVRVVGPAVQLVGIPAHLEAHFVTIPEGVFSIEEQCGGVNYLIVAVALALVFGFVERTSAKGQLLLLAAAVAMAIVANWIRVFGVIYIGHTHGIDSPIVRDHYMFGWVIFGVALIPYFLLGRRIVARWERPEAPVLQPAAAAPWATVNPRFLWMVVLAIALGPAAVVATVIESNSLTLQPIAMPENIATWHASPAGNGAWRPNLNGAASQAYATYEGPNGPVSVALASFSAEAPDAELVTDAEAFVGNKNWALRVTQVKPLAAGNETLNISRTEVRTGDSTRLLVRHWYVVAGRATANRMQAKWDRLRLFTTNDSWSGSVAVAAPCAGDCTAADARLEKFITAAALPLSVAVGGVQNWGSK